MGSMFDVKVVSRFLDRKAIMDKVYKTNKRNLAHAAALTRRVARQSMRKRKEPSRPGQPPRTITGALKNSIIFGWDDEGRTIIVGPTKFSNSMAQSTLERGGEVVIPKSFRKRLFKAGAPPNQGGIGPVVIDRIGERPRLHRWMQLWGNFDPEINKLDGYARVLWRHLRTGEEARHAEKTYAKLISAREFARLTDKVKGRVEARPYMIPAVHKIKTELLELWDGSLH